MTSVPVENMLELGFEVSHRGNVKSEGGKQLRELSKFKRRLFREGKPEGKARKLLRQQISASRSLQTCNNLILVDLDEVFKSEVLLHAGKVALVGVDHLRKVTRVDRHRKVKLLRKRSVEVNEFGTGHSDGLAVLQAVKLVLQHRQLLGVDLERRHVGVDLFLARGQVGFPAFELGLGDFLAAKEGLV